MAFTWEYWRNEEERKRANLLKVPKDDLRVGRVTLAGWRLRWLAHILPETTLYQFLRMLEVPAIIIALVAFGIDYADRPIDRATRRAQLLAQVAQLATIEHDNASGGIKAILEFLANEGVSMRGISLEQTKLSGVDLEGAQLPLANLWSADLSFANLSRADLSFANLSRANLRKADLMFADLTDADLGGARLMGARLMGAYLTGTNLTGANLWLADNLTQDQLDSACISKDGKPPTLPEGEGLKPPPENENCGRW